TAVHLGAFTETEIFAQADPDFLHPPAVAGDRHRIMRKPGVDFDERLFEFVRRHRHLLLQFEIVGRDFYRRACFADGVEISAWIEPRTSAVTIPLVQDQPRIWHDVEHSGNEVAIGAGASALAVFRKAIFVLRPETVYDKRIWPLPALLIGRAVGRPLARSGAVRRRPGQ